VYALLAAERKSLQVVAEQRSVDIVPALKYEDCSCKRAMPGRGSR
jgi:hypothetical protein